MSIKQDLDRLQPIADSGDGRDIIINCPKCGTHGAKAVSYDLLETVNVVIRHRTTWVKCLTCGAKLYSKRPADELIGRSPEELARIVVARVSLIAKVFAILAIATCIFPMVGLAVGVVATIVNWRIEGWLRKLSISGAVVSLLMTALVLAVILSSKEEHPNHAPRQAPHVATAAHE